jgi:arginine:pyruvate transaminase
MIGPKILMDHAENLLICMLYGLPGFVQEAALTALQDTVEAERRVREYCGDRVRLMHTLLQGTPGIDLLVPEAGMFMLVDVRGTGLGSDGFTEQLFREQGVAVMDGGAFGEETRGFVRISFANDEALITEGCRRIRQFCEGLAAVRSR